MHLAELWRYPVKSMGGERLETALLRGDGVEGDRVVHVEGADGRVLTARRHPRLLALRAVLGGDGEPVVDGREWRSPEIASLVRQAAGAGARLVRNEGLERFDVLPLLVATDGAIETLGFDRRRFRPNLILGGVPGLTERAWEGRVLRVGACRIGLADLRGRCVMTTFDPDTQAQDLSVLETIARTLEGTFALNARVLEPGTLTVGDPVELLDR